MMRLVIVGNGMAAWRLCRALSEREAPGARSITLVSEERRTAYDRVHLTSILHGRPAEDLSLASALWYRDRSIELVLGDPACDIDRGRCIVRAVSGREIPYDRLVLATGSNPMVPPVEGIPGPGVFVYRTVGDVEAIREAATRGRRAAVLGGGLLGLEAAQALQHRGLEVDVFELGNRLLGRQLDARGSERLREIIERTGLRVHLRHRVHRISAVGERIQVESDHARQEVDFVVVAVGIRPRDELARNAGLDLGPRGGILVNDALESSDPRIHAIGECAAWRGQLFGFVTPAYRMADVLAERLVGGEAACDAAPFTVRLKLAGVEVATVGQAPHEDPDLVHEGDSTYRRLILLNGVVVGAIGIGGWPELGRIEESVRMSRRPSLVERLRFRFTGSLDGFPGAGDVRAWSENVTVCACVGVPKGVLSRAIAEGCTTAQAVARKTGASTVCGSCRPLLCQLTGEEPPASRGRARPGLIAAATTAALLLVGLASLGPLRPRSSVVGWNLRDAASDPTVRQVTGYSAASLALASLLLPLRRRWKRFPAGSVGLWRVIHGGLGASAVAAVSFHTGLRLGSNFNAALMASFMAVSLSGVLIGTVTGVEERIGGAEAIRLRTMLLRMHQVTFWLWPALLAVHIAASYYF